MPRKTKAKYDTDPIQEVRTFSFKKDQINRLIKALGRVNIKRKKIVDELENCAADYFRIRDQYQRRPTRAEQNAALAEVGQLAREHGSGLRELEYRLRVLDIATEWELMLALPGFDSLNFANAFANTADDVENLTHAAQKALHEGKRKSGPRTSIWIHRTVARLASLYEKSSGKRVSHNPKEKTRYVGRPRSHAGRFIISFFEIVDPRVRETSLSAPMVDYVKFQRSKQP